MITPSSTRRALDPHQVARAFGAILRATREHAGITQEMLAERADCDRTYPSLLERGLRQPTIGKLIDIAGALQVEPAVLVTLTVVRLHEWGVDRLTLNCEDEPDYASRGAEPETRRATP